jgi:hypothetical protein
MMRKTDGLPHDDARVVSYRGLLTHGNAQKLDAALGACAILT